VAAPGEPHVIVRDLTMAFGDVLILRDVNFTVKRGNVFIIMGGSGSGKSVLMRHMVGLLEPARGEIFYGDRSFTRASPEERAEMLRKVGILYQRNALWSSMTLAENVALPLQFYTDLPPKEIDRIVRLKLALVGLKGFEEHTPSQISGGMQKRAALARAIALDPEVVFFDEPSSGLDPLTSRRLDDLMLELRDSLGTTLVVVSHDLASIFTIGDDSILLDAEAKIVIASGHPRELLAHSKDPRVRRFLTRGGEETPRPAAGAGSRPS
jgi:phospholipid/cholesterol/gamma-HCH transport system ATP-binding protein